MKIDMHTHIIPANMPDFTKVFGYEGFIRFDHHKPGFARMMKGDKFFREIESNCWDHILRIDEYAQHNTQYQVVCTIPVMFSYWAVPSDTLTLSVFLNDHIAEIVRKYPNHYIGLGTVPMQDTVLAIKELERCKQIGLKGIQIGSNVNQQNLSEPQFFPIFEACQDLDMAILVHPWEMMGENEMQKYWLPWLVGMPAETTRAACSMIMSGVFEKLPKLRVNFSHAGGSLLYTLGRIDHGFRCRPDLVAVDNPTLPSSYLDRFWVDCITHDELTLKFVLDKIGNKKVTLGSDYPFPLGDLEIGAFIENMNLDSDTLDNIYYKNTLDWLNINHLAV